MFGSELEEILLTRQGSFFSWLPWVKGNPFSTRVLKADMERLKAHYEDIGYYHARIDTVLRRPRRGVIHIQFLSAREIRFGSPALKSLNFPQGLLRTVSR